VPPGAASSQTAWRVSRTARRTTSISHPCCRFHLAEGHSLPGARGSAVPCWEAITWRNNSCRQAYANQMPFVYPSLAWRIHTVARRRISTTTLQFGFSNSDFQGSHILAHTALLTKCITTILIDLASHNVPTLIGVP